MKIFPFNKTLYWWFWRYKMLVEDLEVLFVEYIQRSVNLRLNISVIMLRKQYPSKCFSFRIKAEFLRITHSTLCLRDLYLRLKSFRTHETTRLQRWYQSYFFNKNNISSHREFQALLYFITGIPKQFLRR